MWRLLNTLRKYYIADAAFMIRVNMLTLNYTQAIQDGTWSSNVRQYQYSGFKVPRTPLNCMKEKKKEKQKKNMILIEIQVQNRVLQNAKKKEYCKKKEQKSDEQNRLFFFPRD